MDYQFVGKHREVFKNKLKERKDWYDERAVLLLYDAAIVDVMLAVNEKSEKDMDKQMDLLIETLEKEKK